MEVYIIRHGETPWNAQHRMQGRSDIELNENGRKLAGRLGEQLEEIPFDRIYASPLIRAYETACLIRGHRNIPIIRDERLLEISFGEMEGKPASEWFSEDLPYHFFFSEPEKYQAPAGGETLEEVQARAAAFLKEVVEPSCKETERIMIVAHGAINKGLMCRIEKHGTAQYWGRGLQKNCEAAIFTYDGTDYREVLLEDGPASGKEKLS